MFPRALRLAMVQREERRIMFNLEANMEFASEVETQCIALRNTSLHYTTLYFTALYRSTLYCHLVHCTALH